MTDSIKPLVNLVGNLYSKKHCYDQSVDVNEGTLIQKTGLKRFWAVVTHIFGVNSDKDAAISLIEQQFKKIQTEDPLVEEAKKHIQVFKHVSKNLPGWNLHKALKILTECLEGIKEEKVPSPKPLPPKATDGPMTKEKLHTYALLRWLPESEREKLRTFIQRNPNPEGYTLLLQEPREGDLEIAKEILIQQLLKDPTSPEVRELYQSVCQRDEAFANQLLYLWDLETDPSSKNLSDYISLIKEPIKLKASWEKGKKNTDTEAIQEWLEEIAKKGNDLPLDKLNVALAYILKKNKIGIKEKKERRFLQEIVPRLPEIAKNTDNKTFLQLYALFKKSQLPNDYMSKGDIVPFKGFGTAKPNFTPQDLAKWLEPARRKFLLREGPLNLQTEAPEPFVLIPKSREVPDSQEKAVKEVFAIKDDFPLRDLDLPLIVEAFQKGIVPESFLKRFVDRGLTLLSDYVYPYSVCYTRASRSDDDSLVTHFDSPASAKELLSLSQDNGGVQLLSNTVKAMEKLKWPIQSFQIEILRKLQQALDPNNPKPVTIFSGTGSGKSTMATLVNEIFPMNTPFVIHAAPFPPDPSLGWTKLESWSNLPGGDPPVHLWIESDNLAKLMGAKLPKLMKKALFVLDEYDSQGYRIGKSSVERELTNYGCTHIAKMSATTSLVEAQTKIERWEAKLQKYGKKKQWEEKLAIFQQRKKDLENAIADEFARSMTLSRISETTPETQFAKIVQALKPKDEKSYLLEFPEFRLDPEMINNFKTIMEEQKLNGTLLYRDWEGKMQELQIGTPSKRSPTFCLYTRDSIGGDFEAYSRDEMVGGQFLLYDKTICPSHELLQNLKRLRRREGTPGADLQIFLGSELGDISKEAFLEVAKEKNEVLHKQDEMHRLRQKIRRKKQMWLKRLVNETIRTLEKDLQEPIRRQIDLESVIFQDTDTVEAKQKEVFQKAIRKLKVPSIPTKYQAILKLDELVSQMDENRFYEEITKTAGEEGGTFLEVWTRFLNRKGMHSNETEKLASKGWNESYLVSRGGPAGPDLFKKWLTGKNWSQFRSKVKTQRIEADTFMVKREALQESIDRLKDSGIKLQPVPERHTEDVAFYEEKITHLL